MATIQDELQLTSTDATEVNLPIAGIGSRSYAFLIDWHIRLILALAWLIGVAGLFGMMEGQGFWDEIFDSAGSMVFFVVIVPAAIIYFLYHLVLEVALKGRTPGKRAAGIRIVTTDG
ncbi:MAG: RDD family protein, partial [Gammaproteobacteria bacterium]|nr:RDD family protein [Gammaproteobacteria bacterium]